MTMSRISAPAMAAGFLLSLRHVRERSSSGSSEATMTRPGARVPMDTAASAHPDLRVEVDVEHVNDEVDEHHDEGEKEDSRLHDGEVELADGAHDEPAHSRHSEHCLGDHCAAQQEPKLEAGDRDQGKGGVDESMVADHQPLGHALGARRPHVVEVDHLQHAGAHDAEEERHGGGGEGDRGEDESGGRLPTGYGQEPETDREEEDEHDARPEHGHGGAEEDHEGSSVI